MDIVGTILAILFIAGLVAGLAFPIYLLLRDAWWRERDTPQNRWRKAVEWERYRLDSSYDLRFASLLTDKQPQQMSIAALKQYSGINREMRDVNRTAKYRTLWSVDYRKKSA